MSARMIDLWFIKSDRLKSLRYAVLVASTCMCAWASHVYFDAVDSNEAQRAAFLAREQSRQIRNVSSTPKQDADALAAHNIHEALGFDWNTAFDAIEHDLPKSWGVVSMDVGQDKRMMQLELETSDLAGEPATPKFPPSWMVTRVSHSIAADSRRAIDVQVAVRLAQQSDSY